MHRFAATFIKACEDLDIKVHVEVSYPAGAEYPDVLNAKHPAINRLKQSGVRVFLVAAAGAPALNFVRAASVAGLTGPGYTWLAPDGWSGVTDLLQQLPGQPSIAELVMGGIAMFPYYGKRDTNNMTALAYKLIADEHVWVDSAVELDGTVNLTNAGCPGENQCSQDNNSIPFNNWGYYSFDAALAVARAAVAAGPECRLNGECLVRHIRAEKFNGATGWIELDSDTGDRIPLPGGGGSFGTARQSVRAARCSWR